MAYRLQVVENEEGAPLKPKVSCRDCKWYVVEFEAGPRMVSCMMLHIYKGDPRFRGDRKAHQAFNWNANGDCFGFAREFHLGEFVRASAYNLRIYLRSLLARLGGS